MNADTSKSGKQWTLLLLTVLGMGTGILVSVPLSVWAASHRCSTVLRVAPRPRFARATLPEAVAAGDSQAPASLDWAYHCFGYDDTTPLTLEQAKLDAFRSRAARAKQVDDWDQLEGLSRSDLRTVSFAIPKVIHQTWVGPAKQPKALLDSWRVQHNSKCPGWQHKLWTEENLGELHALDRNFLDREGSPNGKSDILRSAIVYEHGGIYVDADSLWVNGLCLDDILLAASDTGFISAKHPGEEMVASGVFAAVKHHPVSKLYLDAQVILTSGGRTGAPWQTIGPGGISAAVSAADNFATSKFCTAGFSPPSGNSSNAGRSGSGVMPQAYFDARQERASRAVLMTILHERYFYPVSWHKNNMQQATNLTYLAELSENSYPEAVMYQIGMTTHAAANLDFKDS